MSEAKRIRDKAAGKRSADDEAFIAEVREVRQLLIDSNGFTDLLKPLSTRMVFDLLAEFHVISRKTHEAAEARIKALEEGKVIGVKYAGTYQRALPYQRGSCVTYQSSMWTALADVPEGIVPGNNASLWQLSSKGDKPVTVTNPRATK
ncbi:transposase [Mesorhizobium kowhaii]|uniref:Uncharacterized protein n=1 Tax=Mesorhizobium kowhaii TaxID=1300272 RepID=A0A2W7BZH4_9HYPH|nr:transposase [Mesorhizobium kowhaii]PZV36162.1 hypothetical protein B5V02_23435 [Mesorhizobium kowhaii]